MLICCIHYFTVFYIKTFLLNNPTQSVKLEMPDKEFSAMTTEEQLDYVKTLKADVEHKDDEHKTAMEDEKKDHEAKLTAQDDEHKKEMESQDEEHKKEETARAARLQAAILKAQEEPDKEKREAAIMKAMEDHMNEKKNHEGQNNEHEKKEAQEKEEENKAMKAEITYLGSIINKPKIEYLSKIYVAAKTDEKVLKEYVAEWEKMNTKQLDAAIQKVKPLVSTLELTANKVPTETPFGFSTADVPKELSASVGEKSFKKIDNLSDAELFTPGVN